jgi:hypothetical protein
MKMRYAAALLLAGTVLLGCDSKSTPDQKFVTVDITGGEWGKNLQLTDHTGKPRTLADFKGKAVVLFFGYTNCPDVCPTTMVKLASAMEKLGKDAERVQVLGVLLIPVQFTTIAAPSIHAGSRLAPIEIPLQISHLLTGSCHTNILTFRPRCRGHASGRASLSFRLVLP